MAESTNNTTETSNGPIHTAYVPLRWADFDRFGHVNNASYIEIAQEARSMFAMDEFVARGFDMPAVFVRRVEVEYLRPILPDTTQALVETQVTQIGRTSFTTRQQVKDRHGSIACVVEVVQIAMDLVTASPRPISTHEKKILTQVAATEVAAELEADK